VIIIIIIIIVKASKQQRKGTHRHTHTQTHTHTPKLVWEHEDDTVLWNQAVHTDREVTENRPDIIIKTKKGRKRILIGVAIPVERNVVQKEAKKKLK